MKNKKSISELVITSLVTLLPMEVGLLTWNKLPAQMVSHFDFTGTPDQMMPKWAIVFVLPLFLLAMHLLCSIVTVYKNREPFPGKVETLFYWIVPMVSIFVTVLVYGYTFGYVMNISMMAQLFIGLLFLVIGNYLPKVKQNHFAGTRVKWTYESRKNWEHTQRFSGWAMCILGLFFIISAMSGLAERLGNAAFLCLFLTAIIVFALSSVLYSYIYFMKHKEDEDYYDKQNE